MRPFSLAVVRLQLQELCTSYLLYTLYQWLPPMAICRAFSGWTQDDSYRKERGSRTERGVRAYSPAWSELPTRNWVSGVEWDKRGHNSGMTPVNRKAGTGERTRGATGETPGIFKSCRVSPPLIWASDFVMLVRGAEPMEKRQLLILFLPCLSCCMPLLLSVCR